MMICKDESSHMGPIKVYRGLYKNSWRFRARGGKNGERQFHRELFSSSSQLYTDFSCNMNWVTERDPKLYKHCRGESKFSGNEMIKHEQRSGGRSQKYPWFKVPFQWFLKEEN